MQVTISRSRYPVPARVPVEGRCTAEVAPSPYASPYVSPYASPYASTPAVVSRRVTCSYRSFHPLCDHPIDLASCRFG